MSVNYKTPMGSFTTWEEAANACHRVDMDPCTNIVTEVSPTDVCVEHAYGLAYRLPFQVRVF